MHSPAPDYRLESVYLKHEQLKEIIGEVSETLNYQRVRRQVWNEWMGLIDEARKCQIENFIANLEHSDQEQGGGNPFEYLADELKETDRELQEFLRRLPPSFCDLQEELDLIMAKRHFLSECKNQLESRRESVE